MKPHRETLLCRYHYDPLDRLADCTPTAQARSQRFYLKERLTTEIQGALQRSIMQHEDQLLAQQQRQNGTAQPRLLVTDQQRSVLAILDATRSHHLAYTPYGHRIPENGLLSLLGFNGERPDPVTGHYLLGNGYRAFNPVLMRFNSPDSWSPFGEGGLNAYGYGVGDPVNKRDDTGHMPFRKWLGFFNSGRSISSQNLLSHPTQSLSTSQNSLNAPIASTNQAASPIIGNDVTYRIQSEGAIYNIKNPIARNKAKLQNTRHNILNLKNHPDSYMERIIKLTSEEYDFPIAATPLAEKDAPAIQKLLKRLMKQEQHYENKLIKLMKNSKSPQELQTPIRTAH
ncbi:RHS repeat-associated core domain-containing protein [Pseudomonas sp. NPDC087626]|uniref:RHS repeat-associated core domain-containing protein n=1 Tax=Pseudomonas sp. NPDC087626 TaxID=3364444 RepID=UPI00380B54C6